MATPPLPRVALLGLGRMGHPMAERLLAAGAPVTVWNRSPERGTDLVAKGARGARTPSDAVYDAEVVVTMLADPAAIEQVFAAPDGVLKTLRRSALVIDCSTVGPAVARITAEQCAAKGATYVDAPVLGSVPAAEQGTLTILVGGAPPDVERARTVLSHLGRTILHTGDVGSASALKLVMNVLIAGQTELMAEAFLLAERAGLSRQVVTEALTGSVLNSAFVGYKAPQLLDRQFTPLFTTGLLLKDLDLALELARTHGLSLPGVRAARDAYGESAVAGRRDDDFSAVIATLEQPRGEGEERVVYEVTARVDDALAYDYERFMIETHIPDVIRTGCFLHARLDQGGEGQYRTAYQAASQGEVDRYLAEFAPRLREHMTARFPTGVTLSRRVWTERTQWP
jgi:3-hydroxyisobutyrate dehydrogenase-like beta-hydroxyacid dehydrogenase